jgi:quercetin dioxygenase-like cupin family protein
MPDQRQNTGALPPGKAFALEPILKIVEGSIVSRVLVKTPAGSVTLFSFDAGQALSEHTAPFDALATILSGKAEITVGGEPTLAVAGDAVFMPANVPHALKAVEAFKMFLVMIKTN